MTANPEMPSRNYFAVPPLLALLALLLWKNRALTEGIRTGLFLAGHAVIPALFPFAMLSSYLIALAAPLSGGRTRFPPATVPFFVGLLCGFPLGAKSACDGVRFGLWSKKDAERMLCFCNNTGIAFLIAGVGGTMRGNIRDGIILFCVQTIVALLTGIVMRRCRGKSSAENTPALPSAAFPRFPDVMWNAVCSALTVTGYIAFFSGILAVIRTFLPAVLYPYAAACLEVGTACNVLAGMQNSLPLTAFAVIFSGISVHMQTASFAVESGVRIFPAMVCKALGGILGATLTVAFLRFAT